MRLTNADISERYRYVEMYLMRKDFTGTFARWVVEQSPYEVPMITGALAAWNDHVSTVMAGEEVKMFTYDELAAIIHEDVFESIPDIEALNHPRISSGPGYENRHEVGNPHYDFIDLGALARNIFYSMVRHHINWADE